MCEKDSISRQNAIDMLRRCYKYFYNVFDTHDGSAKISLADAEYGIRQLPSAQPEVVRCKNCKHRPTATEADKNIYTGFSVEFPDGICPCQCEDGWYNWYPEDNFYCGKAKRRGES